MGRDERKEIVVEEELESQALAWSHIFGFVNTLVLKCAINLDILDIIAHHPTSPISLPDLAASLPLPCTNLPILRRILRYLAHMHLLLLHTHETHEIHESHESHETETYSLAPASRFLMKSSDKSLLPFAKLVAADNGMALNGLQLCLDGPSNLTALERMKGKSLWELSSGDPQRNELFNEGMASSARLAIPGVMRVCREAFEGMRTLVDLGGGTGTTARAIVKEFPHVRCTVFDLPHVAAAAAEKEEELLGIEYVGGDMFESSIPRADGVIMMWILHDWSDEECVKILKRCKEAIPKEKGRVIIVDAVVGEDQEPQLYHARLALDITMIAYTGGKERTEKEWRMLLIKAGFRQCKITPIKAMQHAIEAFL